MTAPAAWAGPTRLFSHPEACRPLPRAKGTFALEFVAPPWPSRST